MLKSQNYLSCKDMEIFIFFGLSVFFPSHHMYNSKLETNSLTIWFDSFSLKSWNLFVFFFFFNVKNMDQPNLTRNPIDPIHFRPVYNGPFWPGPFWPATQMTWSEHDPTWPFAMSSLILSGEKLIKTVEDHMRTC